MKRSFLIVLIILLIIGVAYIVPTPKHKMAEFDKLRDPVAVASREFFRAEPLKSIKVDGQRWKYLSTGSGPETILFLHGMAGSYDIWWQQILGFKDQYRIISLTYPPVDSLEGLGNAIIKILDTEKIDSANIIGSSLGGYLAQYLKATYPERFKKAIFGNTFPPNDIYKEKNATKVAIARYLPEWLVMYIFRSNVRNVVVPASENSPVVEAYLLEQSYGGMTKQQFLARYQCVVDRFTPSKNIGKDVLIIESDNDPLVFPELRQQLKALYPNALVYTFHGGGHFPYLSKPFYFNKVVEEFLKK
jgi:maspardin